MEIVETEGNLSTDELMGLRPSMVPIFNALKRVQNGEHPSLIKLALDVEFKATVDRGVEYLSERFSTHTLRVATFSCSSTISSILVELHRHFHGRIHAIIGESLPGSQGKMSDTNLFESGISVELVDHGTLTNRLSSGSAEVLLLGAYCILRSGDFINKIGTTLLATAAQSGGIHTIVCADLFKLWDDDFPPPLESRFEVVPKQVIDSIVSPHVDNIDRRVPSNTIF